MIRRPRRNRQHPSIRAAVAETHLRTEHLVQPAFVQDPSFGVEPTEIKSLPGIYRQSLDSLYAYAESLLSVGIHMLALFPVLPEAVKNASADIGLDPQNSYCNAIRELKKRFPELILISDIALDPYSSAGHDGIVSEDGEILNDETVEILAKMAALHAASGADIVAPSDMMDGRVLAIREALDAAGHSRTSILSYTAKYASALYGPFRDACFSAPKSGDKKTYQMDIANRREAYLEADLDIAEGADILMVKPGLFYLDVLSQLREQVDVPLAVYQVSGEYAMIKTAAAAGAIDEAAVFYEAGVACRRAGADFIFTYAAKDMAERLNDA